MRDSTELNQILVRILEENGVASWEYSLEGYRDERQCMELDGENWVVYFGERGRKRRCKTFPTQKDAAAELVRRLGRTETQQAGLQASMERLWKPMKFVPDGDVIRFENLGDWEVAAVFDVTLSETDQKVALLKARLAQLDNSVLRTGSVRKAGKVGMTHTFARKMKQKEKAAKMPKRIETFGFKG